MSGRDIAARSGNAGSVLVVEDDPDIRQALAELLEEEGYDCMLAEDGADALESLGRRTPALLLIDLLMPVMNGVELIAQLGRHEQWRNLPIIVMTAADDRIIGLDVGSLNVPVLRKPVDLGTLAQVLAKFFRSSAEMPDGA
jgi:DNA-binding response OmpR family regulator